MPHDLPPDRAALLQWLGIASDPGTSPDQYDLALAAALEEQRAACELVDDTGAERYTASLHMAALRRAARKLAAKGMTLGVYDAGDFGTSYLPRWDAEVESCEMPYRRPGFA